MSKTRPSHVWIALLGSGLDVKVIYSNVPLYCEHCKKLGHEKAYCLANLTSEPSHVVNVDHVAPVDEIPHFLPSYNASVLGKPPLPQSFPSSRGGSNYRGSRGGRDLDLTMLEAGWEEGIILNTSKPVVLISPNLMTP